MPRACFGRHYSSVLRGISWRKASTSSSLILKMVNSVEGMETWPTEMGSGDCCLSFEDSYICRFISCRRLDK